MRVDAEVEGHMWRYRVLSEAGEEVRRVRWADSETGEVGIWADNFDGVDVRIFPFRIWDKEKGEVAASFPA